METTPPVPGPLTPSMSLGSRMMNVFVTPSDVFDGVKTAPASAANWLAPALLLILAGWLGAWLILSQDSINQQLNDITAKAIEKQIQAKNMSEAQAAAAREAGEKWGGIGVKVSMVAAPVVAAFVAPFWWGLILWLGTLVLKGKSDFMKAVEVAGLANMIGLLEAIVKTLLIVGLGSLFASPGLALLVKNFDPQNTVHTLLALVNVMTFWGLAVRSIGLARLSGASIGKAAVWVFGIWAVYTGFFVALGAVMRAAFGG